MKEERSQNRTNAFLHGWREVCHRHRRDSLEVGERLSLFLPLCRSQYRIGTRGILISSSSESHQPVYHFGEYYLPYGIFTRPPNETGFQVNVSQIISIFTKIVNCLLGGPYEGKDRSLDTVRLYNVR